jgi:K+-transporting ATPase ATPase A chain
MNTFDMLQVVFFLLVLIVLTPLLGRYMTRVFLDENHILKSLVNPVEKTIYRLISCKEDEKDE